MQIGLFSAHLLFAGVAVGLNLCKKFLLELVSSLELFTTSSSSSSLSSMFKGRSVVEIPETETASSTEDGVVVVVVVEDLARRVLRKRFRRFLERIQIVSDFLTRGVGVGGEGGRPLPGRAILVHTIIPACMA